MPNYSNVRTNTKRTGSEWKLKNKSFTFRLDVARFFSPFIRSAIRQFSNRIATLVAMQWDTDKWSENFSIFLCSMLHEENSIENEFGKFRRFFALAFQKTEKTMQNIRFWNFSFDLRREQFWHRVTLWLHIIGNNKRPNPEKKTTRSWTRRTTWPTKHCY